MTPNENGGHAQDRTHTVNEVESKRKDGEDRLCEGGIGLQHDNHIDDRKAGASLGRSGLLARVRARTAQELSGADAGSTTPYVSAALGQTPYLAIGNGAIVVQRRGCSGWNC